MRKSKEMMVSSLATFLLGSSLLFMSTAAAFFISNTPLSQVHARSSFFNQDSSILHPGNDRRLTFDLSSSRSRIKTAVQFVKNENINQVHHSGELNLMIRRGPSESPETRNEECAMDEYGLEVIESLERTSLRLGGLETYVIVSALLSTASYSSILGGDFLVKGANDMVLDTPLNDASLVIGGLSTLLGLYSTVIFSACVLYGKTSVGMDRDDAYQYFMKETKDQRIRGFQAFSTTILLFSMEVTLVLAAKLPHDIQIPGVVACLALVTLGYSDWQSILYAAEPIFTAKKSSNEHE